MTDEILTDYVFSNSNIKTIDGKQRAVAVEKLPEKWRGEERTCTVFRLRYMDENAFEELDFLIETGFDPKLIQNEPFLKRFCSTFGVQNYGRKEFHVWSRATAENLAARGFPIDFKSSFLEMKKTFESLSARR